MGVERQASLMNQVDSLKTGKRFKKTKIGDIPVDWEVGKLKSVISLKYGEGLPENKREGKPYPVYGSNGIVGYHSKFLVEGPGIIVGRKGSIGSITWSDRDFWPIDTTYYIIADLNKANFRWLFYHLTYLRLNRLNAATGIPGLNRHVVLEKKITLPPLPEQKKIAEILSTVDKAIEKSDKVIKKTKELKKGLMQELLTRGVGHKKFKKTKIGEIPVDWEVTKLNSIGILKGGSGFPEKYQGYVDKKYFFLKVSDMNLPKNDIYINTAINTVDEEIREKIRCRVFPKNTIIFAKVGAALLLNRRRILTCESGIDNNMMGLIVNQEYDYKFYYYVMSTIDFAKYVFSGALPSVNQSVLGDIDVVCPLLVEQKKIAKILSAVDEYIEKEIAHKEKMEHIKRGLMQVLLTGKVRVKI